MIAIKHKGNFNNTEKFLRSAINRKNHRRILELYAKKGVEALAEATPIDSGLTASKWGYEIHVSKNQYTITWTNSNVVDGVPIAVILQYGHGTRNGGFVQGRDYINPALQPVFDNLADELWREVTHS